MNSAYQINEVIPNFKTEYYKVGDIESVWLNSHEPDTWICKMIFLKKTENGKHERYYEKHVEKAYKLTVVKNLLHQADYDLVESYSDFKFNKIEKDSKRWFFILSPKATL